jgi:hypothetical protein
MLTSQVRPSPDYFGQIRLDESQAELRRLHDQLFETDGVQVSEFSRPMRTYPADRVIDLGKSIPVVKSEVQTKGSEMTTAIANEHGATIATVSEPPNLGRSSLWSGLDIEVIVGTGEFGSGKSIFGASICPGPETLACDNEGSLTIYKSIGFQHWDMAKELLIRYPNGYTPMQRYIHWRDKSRDMLKSGKYKVFITDPFSEIEAGCAQYVEKHPGQYGYTPAQFQKSTGLFWGAVKEALKADLDNLRTYCETIYLTVHMRNEFVGGRPSGKREPKGKETLFELASLFLEFQREPNTPIPAAKVLKSRLAVPRFDNGNLKMLAVLPPRLPQATAQAIRHYIANPPDYQHLQKEELHVERQMTAEERLLLEADIARNRAEAAQAELSTTERRAQMEAARHASMGVASTPVPDQSAEHAARVQIKAGEAAVTVVDIPGAESRPEPPTPTHCTELQAKTLRDLRAELEIGNADWLDALNRRGAGSIEALTYEAAREMCNKMQMAASQKRATLAEVEKAASEPSKSNPAATTVYNSGPCTQPQIDKIRQCISNAPTAEIRDRLAVQILQHLHAYGCVNDEGQPKLHCLTVSDADVLERALTNNTMEMFFDLKLRKVDMDELVDTMEANGDTK